MGQEKSLPVRCSPTNQNYRTSISSATSTKSVVSATSSNSSSASSTNSALTATSRPSSTLSTTSRTSYKSVDRQSKYLSEHLYIKSYLDIEEEDRNAKKQFRTAPVGGIRNYQPKILTDKQQQQQQQQKQQNKQEVDVWI